MHIFNTFNNMIINMNITYSDDKKTLYYCKLDNKYVIDVFYDVIYILPKDICSIISEYYNCIKVDLISMDDIITINIKNEYIDFKKVIYKGFLRNTFHKFSSNEWYFCSNNIQNVTIYKFNYYNYYSSVQLLDAYMNQIYKINDYFLNKYYYLFNSHCLTITDSLILFRDISYERKYKILDVTLFRYLIEIFKSIIDIYSQ